MTTSSPRQSRRWGSWKKATPSSARAPKSTLILRWGPDRSGFMATAEMGFNSGFSPLWIYFFCSGWRTMMRTQVYWWHDKYRPRKPKYFNRVHTGYEWNKYNQTHYDHDNPPPKIVQGYKFNIFYPDLVDKSKAPVYTIERDGSNGETCLIRFHAGPPYEDIVSPISKKKKKSSVFNDLHAHPLTFPALSLVVCFSCGPIIGGLFPSACHRLPLSRSRSGVLEGCVPSPKASFFIDLHPHPLTFPVLTLVLLFSCGSIRGGYFLSACYLLPLSCSLSR